MGRDADAGETRILLYHAFGVREPPSRFVVPFARFRRQLVVLRLLRYRPIRLSAYAELRREGRPPPRRSVIVTIDDAYADVATVALPLLRRHGVPATLFVPTGYVGRRNEWDDPGTPLHGRPLCSWAELRAAAGEVELGAHTRTHPLLPALALEDAVAEIEAARDDLEQETGVVPRSFAYPHGAAGPELEAAVGALGFRCACGVADGTNTSTTPVHALRRIEIFGTDGVLRFAVKVWTGRRNPRRVDVRRRLLSRRRR